MEKILTIADNLSKELVNNRYVDVIATGSGISKEDGREVITVWIGAISDNQRENLPQEYQGVKVFYIFYNPPSFF